MVTSQYLEWVKTRTPAKFNLASSGVSPVPLAELGLDIKDLEINGPGLYGYEPLQQAIAAHCGAPVECVVAASGTSMANFLAMAAIIEPGDEVLIESPAYDPLVAAAQFLRADVRRFPRSANVADFVSSRTRLIVVTNLHNPSCERLEESQLQEFARIAGQFGLRVLVDEVYLECLYEHSHSAFHLGPAFVSTASLTKAYGLGGLRCGWILAEPELARKMWRLKDLVDPSFPHVAELLSVAAFRKLDRLANRAKLILERNRAVFEEFVRDCPDLELKMPEYGTCVFPRLKSGDADALFETLHERYDTDVVPGRFFEKPDHFRLGIGGDSKVLSEGLSRLGDALRLIRGQ